MKLQHRLLPAAAAVLALIAMGACSKPPETPAAPAVAANVADSDVTQHVTMALQQNASLKGFDIGVVTIKGDVRLSGRLDNQAQVNEAIRVARAADGTHAVHDELTIKK
jgi:hyperosmotically inducible periplasmic protein